MTPRKALMGGLAAGGHMGERACSSKSRTSSGRVAKGQLASDTWWIWERAWRIELAVFDESRDIVGTGGRGLGPQWALGRR